MWIRTAVLAIAAFAAGCTWVGDPGARPIVVTSDSLTLEWTPPVYDFAGVLAISSYGVFYRRHGGPSWTLLQQVPAGAGPVLTIPRSRVGAGSWDFAVDAVNSIGETSPLHASVDPDATPPGGWYVVWD